MQPTATLTAEYNALPPTQRSKSDADGGGRAEPDPGSDAGLRLALSPAFRQKTSETWGARSSGRMPPMNAVPRSKR